MQHFDTDNEAICWQITLPPSKEIVMVQAWHIDKKKPVRFALAAKIARSMVL